MGLPIGAGVLLAPGSMRWLCAVAELLQQWEDVMAAAGGGWVPSLVEARERDE